MRKVRLLITQELVWRVRGARFRRKKTGDSRLLGVRGGVGLLVQGHPLCGVGSRVRFAGRGEGVWGGGGGRACAGPTGVMYLVRAVWRGVALEKALCGLVLAVVDRGVLDGGCCFGRSFILSGSFLVRNLSWNKVGILGKQWAKGKGGVSPEIVVTRFKNVGKVCVALAKSALRRDGLFPGGGWSARDTGRGIEHSARRPSVRRWEIHHRKVILSGGGGAAEICSSLGRGTNGTGHVMTLGRRRPRQIRVSRARAAVHIQRSNFPKWKFNEEVGRSCATQPNKGVYGVWNQWPSSVTCMTRAPCGGEGGSQTLI